MAPDYKLQDFEGDTKKCEWAKKVDQYVVGIDENVVWGRVMQTPLFHVTTGPAPAESTVNSSQLDEASCITTDQEAGPSMQQGNRRKRKMQEMDHCICGVDADSNSNDIVQCMQNGCKTKWVCSHSSWKPYINY